MVMRCVCVCVPVESNKVVFFLLFVFSLVLVRVQHPPVWKVMEFAPITAAAAV